MALAALERYRVLTVEKGWPISESKLGLYLPASVAFDMTASEAVRRENHLEVFRHLRRYWGIGRKGNLWTQNRVFDVLTTNCQPCSLHHGLTLMTLGNAESQDRVVHCLRELRELKTLKSGRYPVMAVSKNLHFFNPRLFVIYDNQVVGGQVYPAFKQDWCSFYASLCLRDYGGIDDYVAYLLWAGHMIRNAYSGFMDDFAEWFINVVREEDGTEAEDMRCELKTYYATFFEFVTIGAALLEGNSACLCA